MEQMTRIGIMGCANIAIRSMIPAIKSAKGFQLKAIASREKEKADKYAQIFNCESVVGYQALLERDDIDLIYMPLPTGLHEEWILKALKHKKHVFVEKSFAMDLESAKRMIDVARKEHLLIMEDFMFKYHNQHQFVFEQIRSGIIGDLRVFRSSFGFPPLSAENFRYNYALGGGCLIDAAAYTVKASQWFLGNDLRVSSSYLDYNNNVDLYGHATLINSEGLASQVAFGFDNFYQCNYEIWGSKGKITAERAFTPRPDYSPRIIIEKQNKKEIIEIMPDNHFVNILLTLNSRLLEKDFEPYYFELLNQSRLLTEIRNQSKILPY